MLFFDCLLKPSLSCHLQGSSADLFASLEAFNIAVPTLHTDDPKKPSQISKFIASSSAQESQYRNVKLSGYHSCSF